jgi:hypothetical protein
MDFLGFLINTESSNLSPDKYINNTNDLFSGYKSNNRDNSNVNYFVNTNIYRNLKPDNININNDLYSNVNNDILINNNDINKNNILSGFTKNDCIKNKIRFICSNIDKSIRLSKKKSLSFNKKYINNINNMFYTCKNKSLSSDYIYDNNSFIKKELVFN